MHVIRRIVFQANLQADRGNSSCVDAWCYLAACYQTQGGVYAKTQPLYFGSAVQDSWGVTENYPVANGLK